MRESGMGVDAPAQQDFGGYATGNHPDGFSNEEWYGIMAVEDDGAGPDIMHPRQVYFDLGQEFAYSAGDYDSDGDRDLADIAAFQRCFASPAAGICGIVFDYVVDGVVDGHDYAVFETCLREPGEPADCGQ